jgi:predicted adenine nucleotide alpha hydrolase (AANH) superfamily ATPase
MKHKILLHACCAPCTAGVIEQLKNDFDVMLFWYNPNISPKEEHDRRLTELLNFCDKQKIRLLVGDYSWEEEHKNWLKIVKGLESEPERGKRCHECYRSRLEATATVAAEINQHHPNELSYFGAELSISPHKDSNCINEMGKEIGKKTGIEFFVADFKKNNGAKLASEISSKHKLYRQNYCGCEFSQSKK